MTCLLSRRRIRKIRRRSVPFLPFACSSKSEFMSQQNVQTDYYCSTMANTTTKTTLAIPNSGLKPSCKITVLE
jgi:hypothetical protein